MNIYSFPSYFYLLFFNSLQSINIGLNFQLVDLHLLALSVTVKDAFLPEKKKVVFMSHTFCSHPLLLEIKLSYLHSPLRVRALKLLQCCTTPIMHFSYLDFCMLSLFSIVIVI